MKNTDKKPSPVLLWLFAAALAAGLLPDMILSFLTKLTGSSSAGISLLIQFLAGIACLLFLMRAISLQLSQEKTRLLPGLTGGFPCLLVCMLFTYGLSNAVPLLAAFYLKGRLLFALIALLLILLFSLCIGVTLFCWMNGCRSIPLLHPALRFFSRIYLGLPMGLLIYASLLGLLLPQLLLSRLGWNSILLLRHIFFIIGAMAAAILQKLALHLGQRIMPKAAACSVLCSSAGQADSAISGSKTHPDKSVAPDAPHIGGAGGSSDSDTWSQPKAPADFHAEPSQANSQAGFRTDSAQTDTQAAFHSDSAQPDTQSAFQADLSQTETPTADDFPEGDNAAKKRHAKSRHTHRTTPHSAHTACWVALALCLVLIFSHNRTSLFSSESTVLREQLRSDLLYYSFYLAASDLNHAAEVAQEAIDTMDEALLAAETFSEELGSDRTLKKLQKVCDKYDIFRTDGQALIYLEQYKRSGIADQDLVEKALTLSEENPDNLQIQYAAAQIGCSLTYDNARHYDRTAKAILRYEALYRDAKKLSNDDLLTLETASAQMLLTVYHPQEAIELLTSLDTETADAAVYELLARAYDRNGQQKEAYAIASAHCGDEDASPYLMYYAALSALKLGKTEECLTYTSELAAYTAACEGDDRNDCDTWLFEMMEFLVLEDDTSYTEFQYAVYTDLTAAENAIIDANPFFRNYLDAMYLAYYAEDQTQPKEAFEALQAVADENENLASVWYLAGVIASNADTDAYSEDAAEYYLLSADLNPEIPAVWYALAREYDRLGEYEKGIDACQKALSLLPEQDHGTDWYGISYHCGNLLKALQREVNS